MYIVHCTWYGIFNNRGRGVPHFISQGGLLGMENFTLLFILFLKPSLRCHVWFMSGFSKLKDQNEPTSSPVHINLCSAPLGQKPSCGHRVCCQPPWSWSSPAQSWPVPISIQPQPIPLAASHTRRCSLFTTMGFTLHGGQSSQQFREHQH